MSTYHTARPVFKERQPKKQFTITKRSRVIELSDRNLDFEHFHKNQTIFLFHTVNHEL